MDGNSGRFNWTNEPPKKEPEIFTIPVIIVVTAMITFTFTSLLWAMVG